MICAVLTATAPAAHAGSNHKIAIHVLSHERRTCDSGLPRIQTCKDIQYTYDACTDIDVFPIFFDLSGVTGIEVGLMWPGSWGSCAFTPCGFDFVIGTIEQPGDAMAGTWYQCRHDLCVVAGYGWLAPSSGGEICPVPSAVTDFMGVTDCDFVQYPPAAYYCAGACGTGGENPCGGGISEGKSWGAIKSMFK